MLELLSTLMKTLNLVHTSVIYAHYEGHFQIRSHLRFDPFVTFRGHLSIDVLSSKKTALFELNTADTLISLLPCL